MAINTEPWKQKLADGLNRPDYIGFCRAVLVEMRDVGFSSDHALEILAELRGEAQEDESEAREDQVLEIMDFAAGWCNASWRVWPGTP